jgi:hypothetical protein
MKNPFKAVLSNNTARSAAIVVGSAVAYIALAKGFGVFRKKFGKSPKLKPLFDAFGGPRGEENAQSNAVHGIRRAAENACEVTDCARPKAEGTCECAGY